MLRNTTNIKCSTINFIVDFYFYIRAYRKFIDECLQYFEDNSSSVVRVVAYPWVGFFDSGRSDNLLNAPITVTGDVSSQENGELLPGVTLQLGKCSVAKF